MISALASGLLLGLSAGLSPGPLLALVLTQTFRYGPREGCKVALVPLVTDSPIILLVWFLAGRLADEGTWLGLISLAGGAFVFYLAWDTLQTPRVASEGSIEHPSSWFRGIVTNLFNPHPWLFWLTVGVTILARALTQSVLAAASFLFGFYAMLVGSKLLIAMLAGRSRGLLGGHAYRILMRILAGLLAVFACLLLWDGWKRLAA